jgi:hypothetical protein
MTTFYENVSTEHHRQKSSGNASLLDVRKARSGHGISRINLVDRAMQMKDIDMVRQLVLEKSPDLKWEQLHETHPDVFSMGSMP